MVKEVTPQKIGNVIGEIQKGIEEGKKEVKK